MLVNLPNGRTVNMSIDQYLSLTDDDIKYMVSLNCGSTASSPWCGSAIKKPGRIRVTDEEEDDDINTGLTEDELDLDDEQWEAENIADPDTPEPGE